MAAPEAPVTTIFCAQLPADMTEREFFNMFQMADGFEEASLKQSGTGNLMGFARFSTSAQAELVVGWLNGRTVDPATGLTIVCDMARNNLHVRGGPRAKRPLEESALSQPLAKVPRTPAALVIRDVRDRPPPQTYRVPVQEPVRMAGPSRCDTLHVSGFEANTTERDLQEFARCFDGFKEMRLIDTPFKRFALMQFNNDSYAEQALGSMSNYPLNGTSLIVAFSKSPLGVPKHRPRDVREVAF
eukprot:CAMPEP_0174363740 /NCGR_PEP_ID=MMETSP0811_2-20130205/70009_1 /TAXON_ID=73025 ORGANISM="Eutreptiella gymnastica-like, Strain CCMP1594" /NCGR_SAMPLE_ID=MMETSP0811_2 /ASSEMBLY_ACC=CAM_ASM_000667 /LENGTH=242 /DNA_ID=CAMNT_0015502695 /DNA_START=23 /DNA_END=751 /DNA_ORIENTATION=+